MFIAQEKLKTNIAEYILYMWQIEDLIRGLNFDINLIQDQIINQTKVSETEKEQMKSWYLSLIDKMKTQGIVEKGHLLELREKEGELFYLHNMLIESMKDQKYIDAFEEAKEDLETFKKLSQISGDNPIHVLLSALYSKLLLRLQKKQISKETESTMKLFSKTLAYLAAKYNSIYAAG